MDGSSSQLCKRQFFQRFGALVSGNVEWRRLIEAHKRNGRVEYKALKRAAREFGEAKEMLQSSLVIGRLGTWVKKPVEQDSFEIGIIEPLEY